jgi:hypothetical protein
MLKACLKCGKEFTSGRKKIPTKFCSMKCYQKTRQKDKYNPFIFLVYVFFITSPILLSAFILFHRSPKNDKKYKIEKTNIPYSSCK